MNTPSPQFCTAEYVGKPGNDHCQFCQQPIAGAYYRTNGAMTCPACAQNMQGQSSKDTHAAFVRALLFGAGAAVLGMILYAAFAIITGIVIGYASLAVGWLVGKAMITGSNGVGGRRYQIAAVLLTYAAVSTAAIPIWIHYARQHRPAQQQAMQQQEGSRGSSQQPEGEEPQRHTRAAALGMLLLLGLASPFLELSGNAFGGIIGLVILFVGMQFAWRFTAAKPLEIFGPFDDTKPASA